MKTRQPRVLLGTLLGAFSDTERIIGQNVSDVVVVVGVRALFENHRGSTFTNMDYDVQMDLF